MQIGVVEWTGDMRLEFHQLERRLEHLRVHRPERQRRLLASLAASGQQTPIVVVACEQAGHYLVIDGHQRVAALTQLGRDTVEAVVWSLSESEALLLDRSMRWGERDTALEEGWLLAELEQRFGYGLEELARRFDRSTSWVSRRLALVELLPEGVQQQVRSGAIAAHVAMKFLVPVARSRPEDCRRMAERFARYRLSSREAGQLYAAWRTAAPSVRDRLLDDPQLFLKTQRQRAVGRPSPAMVELGRDLEVVVAITRRANRRLSGTTVELDLPQCAETQNKIHQALEELGRLAARIPHPQGGEDAESKSTNHDSGTEHAASEQARDRADTEGQPAVGDRGAALWLGGSADVIPNGVIRALPAADPGTVAHVQGQSGTCAGGTGGQWSEPVVLGVDRFLPPPWDRAGAEGGRGAVCVPSGKRTSARHISARGSTGRQASQGADRLGGTVLLAHAVLPVVSNLPAFRLQSLPGRSSALLQRFDRTRNDRQHACRGAARHRTGDGSGARDGGFCRSFRLPLRGS